MSNAGQLWSAKAQIGKEVTAGTGVAATRIMYFNTDMALSRNRAPREHRFAVGRRDNILAYTNGPIEAGGSVGMPMSADEILELLAITLQGGVTATTPTGAVAGRQFVFKPSNTLDSATVEWDDGARAWRGLGVRGDTITIAGSAMDTNMVTADLFATDVQVNALTGSLTDRVPTFMEGWQTRLYVDAFGSAPGTTPAPSFLRNWSVQLQNGLSRLYTADNTLSANRITSGELNVSATLTVDASSAQAATEFANWDATTKRVIRLEFLGPNAEIEAGINEVQSIATTGTPTGGTFTVVILGQTTGTIAFNAAAGAVQTAINAALAALGSTYTVTCGGGPLPTAVTVTFNGAGVAARDVSPITLGTNSLTGGSSPAPVLATTTPGYSGGRRVLVDIPGAWTTMDLSGQNDGIRTYEMALQSVYEPTTLAAMLAITCQTNRTAIFV